MILETVILRVRLLVEIVLVQVLEMVKVVVVVVVVAIVIHMWCTSGWMIAASGKATRTAKSTTIACFISTGKNL